MGEMELMSTTILPGLKPSATPLTPNSTFSTSGVSGTMVKMISALCATSLPVYYGGTPDFRFRHPLRCEKQPVQTERRWHASGAHRA